MKLELNSLSTVIKVPEKREQISGVVPRARSRSPKLATVSMKVSNNATLSSLEEVRSLADGGNRGNASRELTLPVDMDVVRIVSEDTDSEESGESSEDETPETLPEVSQSGQIKSGVYLHGGRSCINDLSLPDFFLTTGER